VLSLVEPDDGKSNNDNDTRPPLPRTRLRTARDVAHAGGRLYRLVLGGRMDAGDASKLASVLALVLRALESGEMERRVEELERMLNVRARR
jgi:hypothetical protein